MNLIIVVMKKIAQPKMHILKRGAPRGRMGEWRLGRGAWRKRSVRRFAMLPCPATTRGGRGDEEQATSKQESIFYENNDYRLLPIMLFSPKESNKQGVSPLTKGAPSVGGRELP